MIFFKGRVTWYNPVGTKEEFNEEDEGEEEEERNEPDEPQQEVGPPLLTPLAEDESKYLTNLVIQTIILCFFSR